MPPAVVLLVMIGDSADGVMVICTTSGALVPSALVAVRLRLKRPAVVGDPATKPVALIESPAGSGPTAAKLSGVKLAVV